jgi:hypothetical protein
MRNANVYFDMTDTSAEHLREAIRRAPDVNALIGS